MTDDPIVGFDHEHPAEGGRRRRRRSRLPGCLAVAVAMAVVLGGVYFLATRGVDALADRFAEPEDFEGPGKGSVTFEVEQGDSVAEMGRGLKADGIVASVEAFTEEAAANPDSTSIQVGAYEMKKRMPAADALEILLDPDNILKNTVTIPEGLRVEDIVALLAKNTDYGAAQFQRVLDDPAALGLPDYAEGDPEGYLFPSTYDFGPKEGPKGILTTMVDRWEQAASEADLESAASELGYTPAEVREALNDLEVEDAPIEEIVRLALKSLAAERRRAGTR